jgi:hypothetical protein
MMRNWIKKLIILVLILCPALINAREREHSRLRIKLSAPVYQAAGKKNNIVSCYADMRLLKGKLSGFGFYAMNDIRNVPMELTADGKPLPFTSAANKGGEAMLFTAQLKDIFLLHAADSHYRWKWHARAKAPVSPVADVAGQKVKQVKCWFTLQVNQQHYSSDTVSISIQ